MPPPHGHANNVICTQQPSIHTLIKKHYDDFCIQNPANTVSVTPGANLSASSTSAAPALPSALDTSRTSLSSSLKNMKFTPSKFAVFNNSAKWHGWNEVLTSFGHAMTFSEIFDLQFKTPTDETSDAFAAFDWKNSQFNPIFNVKVQTNEGHDIVAKH
jgi:hypothetical protein